MLNIEMPTVYPVNGGKFVTIPSEAWQELCGIVQKIIEAVNEQSETVSTLSADTDTRLNTLSDNVQQCNTNISKIAEIMEDIYENLE